MPTKAVALIDTPQSPYLPQIDTVAVEQAMMIGDLGKMSPEVRIAYYVATCRSVGLNPLTRPFQALKTESGEVLLYLDKSGAEQLRKRDGISVRILARTYVDDLYIVTAEARTPDGRTEESEGVVVVEEPEGHWEEGVKQNGQKYRFKKDILGGDGKPVMKRLAGAAMANARMKAETKAKRRVTMAICGLGMPEEDGGAHASFDPRNGVLQESPAIQAAEEIPPRDTTRASTAEAIDALFGDGAGGRAVDTFREPPSDPAIKEKLCAEIEEWYTAVHTPAKYEAFCVWAQKRYGVASVLDIPTETLAGLALRVAQTLGHALSEDALPEDPMASPE